MGQRVVPEILDNKPLHYVQAYTQDWCMLVHLPPNGVGGVCWLIDSNYFEKREENSNKIRNTRKNGRDPIVSRPGLIHLPQPANELRTRYNRVPTVFRV